MHARGRISVVVCATASSSLLLLLLSSSCCDAADVYRAKRGVVPGSSASRPKDTIRKSECRNDNSCKALPKTSCDRDPLDGQMRCLCADQTHPINDDCITLPQGIGMPCEKDIQCIQLTQCVFNVSAHSDFKICQCREEFMDEDGTCSGGVRAIISIYLAILVAIVLQNNHN